MSTNGNANVEEKPLSPLLKVLLSKGEISSEVAQEANQLTDIKLQNAYLHGYRQGLKVRETDPSSGLRPPLPTACRGLREVAGESFSRMPSPEKGEGTTTPSPSSGEGRGEGGFSLPTPHGRIGKAVKSIEKVAAWDMVGELEEWMAVKVPPYRAARRVFSWLWMAFGAEAMLATLISCVMLYGAFLGVRWMYRRVTQGPAPSAQVSVAKSGSPLEPGNSSPAPAVFQITSATYVDGNKLELHWTSLGTDYTYRVFAKCNAADESVRPFPVTDRAVSTAGARVNINYDNGCPTPVVQVLPIAPSGAAEEFSNPVTFRLSVLNNETSVEPIALEATLQTSVPESSQKAVLASGAKPSRSPKKEIAALHPVARNDSENASTNKTVPVQKPTFVSSLTNQLLKNADGTITSGLIHHPLFGQGLVAAKNAALTANDQAAPPAPATTIPLVTGIHADEVSPEEIHLSWDYLGPGYTYNAYTDVEYEMKKPWKENEKPLHAPGADWQPERGLDFYWLAVTAIDRNGHEGKMSEPIYVKVR